MTEWWLIACFLIVICVALMVALYPHKSSLKQAGMVMVPMLLVFAFLAYHHWGAWPQWRRHIHAQERQQEAQAYLESIKSPEELIEKLRARLKSNPESAKGWYLLGRLYGNQNQWGDASDAYKTAHRLNPDDDRTTLAYAESLWELNAKQGNELFSDLVLSVLRKNPKQPDALSLLAMDAFSKGDYKKAESYWQLVLMQVPPNSEEAKSLRKAIKVSREKGGAK
jgi:cytochrome c-type biogenesis protein CcmH/NrfG